jgi:hypothetical protein
VLHLCFDQETAFPVTVELNLEAFVRPGLAQSVAIAVNGRRVTMLEFEPSGPRRVETIEIHASDLSPGVSAEIAFDIANPTAPAEVEPSTDHRKLGVAITRLRVLG